LKNLGTKAQKCLNRTLKNSPRVPNWIPREARIPGFPIGLPRKLTHVLAWKVYAAELGKLAKLDVHAHAEAMLEAKANVDHLSPAELIMMDTKVFKIGGKNLRVSVLETTKASGPLAKKAKLVEAMTELIKKDKVDDVLFFVVDIMKESATFISSSPTAASLIEKAWNVKVDKDGLALLPGVLSRKKQIIPKLEAAAKLEEL